MEYFIIYLIGGLFSVLITGLENRYHILESKSKLLEDYTDFSTPASGIKYIFLLSWVTGLIFVMMFIIMSISILLNKIKSIYEGK